MPDRRVELQIAGTWTDVSDYLYERDPITITYGRTDEGTQVDPGACTLTLNNRDGRFSSRNPWSPYYGLIGRNTPIRVSVPGSESYLDLAAGGSATTPDVAALDIIADIDIRIEATADWYADGGQVLAAKWSGANLSNASWVFALLDRTLIFQWAEDSATSVTVQRVLPALPPRAALRVTLDTTDPSGGFTGRLYWAPSMAGPWTQFGTDTTDPLASKIAASTAPLVIAGAVAGVAGLTGRVHQAEVRNGINGTIVANPDFRSRPLGNAPFVDSASRTWTLSQAEINNRHYRFAGEVSSWPPEWDVSGTDVWVSIEAAGVLQRLGQGRKPLASTLRRRIPSAAGLLAYWPMEEAQGATQAASPLPGVRALKVSGLDWAADDTLGGSDPLPKTQNPAALSGTIPSTTITGWQTEFVYYLPTLPAAQTEILRVTVTGSTLRTAVIYASTAGIRLEVRDNDDTVIASVLGSAPAASLTDFAGRWNRLHLYTEDRGSGQSGLVAGWLDTTGLGGGWGVSVSYTGTPGRATGLAATWGAATEGMTVGHLAVFSNPYNTIFEGADDGFAGEKALTRMRRLAAEEPALILHTVEGDLTTGSERLGPQRSNALMDLLQEAADADGGILYEDRDSLSLVYRDRASLYNQTPVLVLDYTARGETGTSLTPVEDDQHLRNDVTVQREGGSSGRVVIEDGPLSTRPPEDGGVGIYDTSVTLSLATDEQTEQIAAWRAHLGTWDEARYPSINVQLHTAAHLIDDVLLLRVGDKGVVQNPPPWLPPDPIEFLVYGYTETLGPVIWDVTMNTVPAGPWMVAVTDDPDSRADASSSRLTVSAIATATTLQITTDGARWADSATYGADFPFDIQVGGEVMTVTAITGTTSPQTATVIRSVNGIVKSHPAGSPVQLAIPPIAAL